MDQIPNRYPGIIKVECFDSQVLPPVRIDYITVESLHSFIPDVRMEIPLIEPGTCEVSSVDGCDKLTLKFSAACKISRSCRWAFIFYDANGGSFLVASVSKPFPKVSINRSFGSVPDQRPEFAYEISHVAVKTPIEIFM